MTSIYYRRDKKYEVLKDILGKLSKKNYLVVKRSLYSYDKHDMIHIKKTFMTDSKSFIKRILVNKFMWSTFLSQNFIWSKKISVNIFWNKFFWELLINSDSDELFVFKFTRFGKILSKCISDGFMTDSKKFFAKSSFITFFRDL